MIVVTTPRSYWKFKKEDKEMMIKQLNNLREMDRNLPISISVPTLGIRIETIAKNAAEMLEKLLKDGSSF